MNGVPEEARNADDKRLWKSMALAGWVVAGVAFWGWIAAIALLGSAMAEPPGPDADFTMLYVLVAFVALLFVCWCAATRLLIRRLRLGGEGLWLAALIALLAVVVLLQF